MTNEPKKGERRYDIDWLRVIAVTVLVLHHTAAIFNPYDPFPPIRGKPTMVFAVGTAFFHEWRLAILFIVSGAGSYFALRSLSGARFARGRFRRLTVPLVLGILLLVPVHQYFGLRFQDPSFPYTFPQYLVAIVVALFRTGRFGNGLMSLNWAHLWFLTYLFVASMLALPLFLYLKRERGRRLTARVAGFLSRGWAIFLLALPLAAVEVTLRARWRFTQLLLVDDWANFFFYAILFVYGYVIFSDERIRRALERRARAALFLGVIASAVFLVLTFTGREPAAGYTVRWTLYMLLHGFNAWCWCVAVLGFGSRHLNFSHRLLPYANEAVYPVYVLHLPISTVIASRVVGSNMGVGAQFALIALGTLASSVALYAFVIRRTRVTRFLFGLKPLKPRRPEPPEPAPAAAPSLQTPEEVTATNL
jgi:peptidoglycan/LPS O-acetylase OafA/YrhL